MYIVGMEVAAMGGMTEFKGAANEDGARGDMFGGEKGLIGP